jgi:hypothetical protein
MASSHDPIGPVSSAGGAQGTHPVDGSDASQSKGGIPQIDVRSTSFIYAVISLTNLAMEKQSDVVGLQAQLADVVSKIQSAFSTMNSFFEQMIAQTKQAGFMDTYVTDHDESNPDGYDMNPNALSGLDSHFYALDDNNTSASPAGQVFGQDQGLVSQSYQDAMKGFVNAVRSLFSCSPTGDTETVGQASKMDNPYGGPGFDFNAPGGLWSQLNTAYSKYSFGGHEMFSTKSSDHMSLMQEYTAIKMKINIVTGDKDTVTAAAKSGDYSSLGNFDPSKPGNLDAMMGPVVQFLNSLNVTVTADRSGYGDNAHYAADPTTTRNLLSMIMTDTKDSSGNVVAGDLYASVFNSHEPEQGWGETDGYSGKQVGLFGAFAYAALDYVGTKTPNGGDASDPNTATGGFFGHNITGRVAIAE